MCCPSFFCSGGVKSRLSSALRLPLLLSLKCLGAGVGVEGSACREEDMGELVSGTRAENNERERVRAEKGVSV